MENLTISIQDIIQGKSQESKDKLDSASFDFNMQNMQSQSLKSKQKMFKPVVLPNESADVDIQSQDELISDFDTEQLGNVGFVD